VWRGWKPGGEYERVLTVRNVSTRTIKLKYKLPTSKYFSMAFPEPIKLVAGMSYPVRVLFRPVKLEHCEDVVQFTVGAAVFSVSISAFVPTVSLEIPAQIDFGFSAVNEV
jgi:hypothetical protein